MDSRSSQSIGSKRDGTVIKISRIFEDSNRLGTKRKNQTVCSLENKKTKIMNKDEMRALLLESANIVERANNNIIIHGLKTDLVKEDVEKLFNSLNIPPQNAPKIVSVVQLGKVPSILVILQNQYQRNKILIT